jgi:hypothetical protein
VREANHNLNRLLDKPGDHSVNGYALYKKIAFRGLLDREGVISVSRPRIQIGVAAYCFNGVERPLFGVFWP